jgi:hypothetical protein
MQRVAGEFRCEDFGTLQLKGLGQQQVWRVVALLD